MRRTILPDAKNSDLRIGEASRQADSSIGSAPARGVGLGYLRARLSVFAPSAEQDRVGEYRAAGSHLRRKPVRQRFGCDLLCGCDAGLLDQRQHGTDSSGQQRGPGPVVRPEMRLHSLHAQRLHPSVV